MNFARKELICPADIAGRKAHRFSQKISSIKSDIYIKKNDTTINAKSLLGILSVQFKTGDKITISCNNEDENLAKLELNHIITVLNGLGIDETL